MSDYIKRSDAIDATLKDPIGQMLANRYNLIGFLEGLPSADVRENRTGKWIRGDSEKITRMWKCSKCGNKIYSESWRDRKEFHAFCGRCGADMRQNKKLQHADNDTAYGGLQSAT